MAIHMFRVVAAKNSTDTTGMTEAEIRNAMNDWVSKNSNWVENNSDLEMRTVQPSGTPEEYYSGDYRFELTDAKDNLLQKCGDKLKKKVDWYRIGYHECTHDGEGECSSWNDERNWTSKNTTSVPNYVQKFV